MKFGLKVPIERVMKPRILQLVCGIVFAAFPSVLTGGDTYDLWVIDGQSYHNVQVLSRNASSLSIRHAKGIAQVPLAALSPELQTKYSYIASSDARRQRELDLLRMQQQKDAERRLTTIKEEARKKTARYANSVSHEIKRAFASFGSPPDISPQIDLRKDFREHGLFVTNQGRQPSCAIHSIVSALEFQYAENHGVSLNISESDLFRNTVRSLGREPSNGALSDGPPGKSEIRADAGFTLEIVFQAIRGYGLKLESKNRPPGSTEGLEAMGEIHFSPFIVPGGNSEVGVQNLIHVLNTRMPIVVGLGWPTYSRLRNTALLSKQSVDTGSSHAITIVGYKNDEDKIEETKFIFRNSWGARWGAGGYGFVTYEYLRKHLYSAYVVELR